MNSLKQVTIDISSLEQLAIACRILKTAVVRMMPLASTDDERSREAKEHIWAATTEILTTLEHLGVPTDTAMLAGEVEAVPSTVLGSDANQKLYAALDAAYDAMDAVHEERSRPTDSLTLALLLLMLGHVRRELKQAGELSLT